jgi:pectin methylesterase-like acyl-CoA thioesterase/sugar lactone lactonase YvrE
MHVRSTASGEVTFRGGNSGFASNRRWMTGFQLIPYPKPTIVEQPPAESVAVLNVSTEITAVARDMMNMRFASETDQNPLTYSWQFSNNNGSTWSDIADDDPDNPQATPTGPYDVFLDRDPPLPADPDEPAPPAKRLVSTLVLNSPQFADAGLYRLKVTNVAGGSTYSDPCELTVIEFADPFLITRQPVDTSCVVGDNVNLSVAVAGTPPFTYIWQKQSCDTATATPGGATTTGDFVDVLTVRKTRLTDSTLDFPFVRRSDTGYYRVKIMDVMQKEADALYSDVVYFYAEYAPPIITPPGKQTVAPGNTINLYSDIYTEIPLLSHQWQISRDNGATWQNITDDGTYSGATTGTLTITGAGASETALYRVVSSNALGTTEGGAISLKVGDPLVAHPVAVAADGAERVYVVDDTSNILYQYATASGTAVLFAGQTGVAGSADGYYGQLTFSGPTAAAIGPANIVYVADTGNATIRAIRSNGQGTTIAGSPGVRGNTDATGAAASFTAPAGITYDAAGNLYVADRMAHTIRRITPTTFDVTTLAGVANVPGTEGGTTTENSGNPVARFNSPGDIAASPVTFAATGSTVVTTGSSTSTILYVADAGNHVIRKITLTWYLDRDPVTNALTRTRIRENNVSVLAGMTGVSGYADGIASAASFNNPTSLAVIDNAIYVADTGNNTIRLIEITGANGSDIQVSTVAGLPTIAGYQDGPENHNLFNQPGAISADNEGNLYVADTGNAAVRKITRSTTPDGVLSHTVSTLVFEKGASPVPPAPDDGGNTDVPDIPQAGAGDGHGEFGGGAPSLWFLGVLAFLGLFRTRKHLMKIKTFFCIGLAGILAAALAPTPSARAADAPAVFLKLTRVAASAGATPTVATTSTISVPGSGWDYSAAASFSGTIWNVIQRPADADSQNFPTAIGTYTFNTVNNLALAAPDGSASGVSVTASLEVTKSNGSRAEPGYGSVTADTVLGPVALMNNNGNWRVYYGDNNTIWEFAGLPAGTHYLAYCYGATHTVGQGARFILPVEYKPASTGTQAWFDTHGGDGTNANVFVETAGIISPRAPAPLEVTSNTSPNINTVWGVFHAKVDAAGKLVLRTAKNAQNGQYLTGFQLVPYPKAAITTNLPPTTAATVNNSLTLTVAATGFDAGDVITYQWRKDGTDIPGATGASHTIASAQASHEGSYDVVVTNYGGDTISNATVLSVTTSSVSPGITSQPVAQTADAGGNVSFTVSANGTSPLTYTWQHSVTGTDDADFSDIAGSNSATLALSSITTADAGYYRVKITNGTLPDAVSNAATLIVTPVITAQPSGNVVTAGSPATLGVTADTGIAAAPFAPAYTWKRNGVEIADGAGISGATTATLSFASFAAANSGVYTVTVTNAAGSVTSDSVYLGTPAAMTATQWPANNATGVNPDSPLKLTFTGGTPVLGTTGKIIIRDAADDSVVETIDLSALLETNQDSHRFPSQAIKTTQGMQIYYQPVAIYGNEVWITHASGNTLQYSKTYYVTIDPGVLFDELGATYPGMSGAASWRFSTRTAAPDISSRTIAVAADGTGDYTTLQCAFDAIPQNNTAATPYVISLAPGVYHERAALRQNRHYVTIKGTGAARTDTVLSHGWTGTPTSGEKNAVLMLSVTDVRVENLTIENTAGQVGPQMALYGDKYRHVFDNLLIKGWQDTLGAWNGQVAYFRDCEIWGSVDFIYSAGTGFFDHCDIVQIRGTGGPLAAPSTDYNNPHGFIFNNCRLIKGQISKGHPMDVAANSSTLMRAWYQNGYTAYINCTMDDHITLKGWQEWDGKETTCRAIEYGSTWSANGASIDVASRQASGAYWLNTSDPDYTGATDQYKTDPLLLLPDGPFNRTPVVVNPANFTIDAIFGNAAYSLGAWRPTVAPRFVTQPASQTVGVGTTVTLSAEGFGLPAVTYQWYKGAQSISGATNATYTISNPAVTDSGDYHVVITNSLGTATSAAATLAVGTASSSPDITAQPVSLITNAGDSVTLSVAATGGSLTYQWYKNGALLSGETGATLAIANPQASDSGSYHVVITNSLGDATSATVTLTVEDASPAQAVFVTLTRTNAPAGDKTPVVTDIPVAGNGWNYSAAAPHAGTVWNGVYAPGNTTSGTYPEASPFRLNSLDAATLVNPAGNASGVTLTGDLIVATERSGGEPGNAAAANGIPAKHMDKVWRVYNADNYIRFTFGGLKAGAHYLLYTYASAGGANQGGRMNLDTGNVPAGQTEAFIDMSGYKAGSTNSNIFTTNNDGLTVPIAAAQLNTVAATDDDTQWGVMHAVATSSQQVTVRTARSGAGTYFFNGFQLIPYPKAAITAQPDMTKVVTAGGSATLTVVAAGFDSSDTVTYQWRKDGVPINTAVNATANTASLVISNAQPSDAGGYDVAVTNLGGSVISDACALSVSDSSATSAPDITAQPVSQIANAGDSVTLSVDATGGALAYQWYKDGVAIFGANGADLTIANPQVSDSGSYYVVITNSLGEATSATVTLTVEGGAAAEAVFVKMSRDGATAGARPTDAETLSIDVQGDGWNYSAAARYEGITWNKIRMPHADDQINSNSTGVDGTFRVNTADGIALFTPSGAASGATLSIDIVIADRENNTTRKEPNYCTGATTSLAPKGLMETGWRIYRGGNSSVYTVDGLASNKHYLAYFYGAAGANQGSRYTLAAGNAANPAITWVETNAQLANTEVFVTDGTAIIPKPVSSPMTNATNAQDKPWGFLHAITDASGKLVFTTSRSSAGGQYYQGFQLIPYPKAVIDVDAPASISVPAGGSTTISVTALGFDAGDTVTYQWRKNGAPINTAANATANTDSLVISDAQAADEADYDVVITNYGGSIISGVCELTVLPGVGAPTIYTQPVSQTGITGATVNFSAAVGGLAPLTYAWQKSDTGNAADFADIPGGVNSALVLAGITTADAGYYRIKVSNAEGEATSDVVTLVVAPAITTQPASAVVVVGDPAFVTVVANTGINAAPFAPFYQWHFEGFDIPGATSATYSIASFGLADAGAYTVTVTNAAGSVTSNAAVLGNPVLPVFTTQPTGQTKVAGLGVSFVSSASGIPSPTYQWHFNGAPIAGATSATYAITSVAFADSGTYTVVAGNMAGNVTSDPAVLTVRDPAGPAVTSDGFASGVTGGAGGTVYVVTTADDLQAKASLAGPAVITISGTINLSGLSNRRVAVASNKTIQGADADATVVGAIHIAHVNNVIVRGLTLTNPGTTIDTDPSSPTYGKYIDSGDGISVWGSTNVFITHCTLYNCGDGCVDITRPEVNNVTVSWCKFYFGGDQLAHRFTMILGNTEPDNADYIAPVHATLHHNWWSTLSHERMPASTSARGHMYGNYFSCSGNYYSSNARNNSHLFIEHSYYGTGVNNPVQKSNGTTALIRTIGNIYNGTTGSYDAGIDTVFTPPYSYQMPAAADLPVLIPQYAGNTDGAFSGNPATDGSAVITGLPGVIFPGDNITFTASVSGASYQWRRNNFELSGETGATLALTNIQGPQTGVYTVAITKADGSTIVSAPVTLDFGDAPSFAGTTGGPVNVVTGKSATIQPVINGTVYSYQWQRMVGGQWENISDNANYSGATTGALVIQNAGADQAGQYQLVVTNPTGTMTSGAYTLTVAPVVFAWPSGVAVDAYGDVYVSDASAGIIRRVSATGTASLYAGIPGTAGHQDGSFGLSSFDSPGALAIDASGNLIVADTGNATIRHVDRENYVRTLAGDPSARGSRDGIGTAAIFQSPNGISFDRATGVTYMADTNNHTIRSLTPRALNNNIFVGNTVATLAGAPGQSGSNDAYLITVSATDNFGTVTSTTALNDTPRFNHPGAVAYSGSFVYIADTGNNTIRRLTTTGTFRGEVATIAGTPGVNGYDDGDGLAEALFNQPKSLVLSPSGQALYVADTGNNTIRRIVINGTNPVTVSTLAGLPGVGGLGDGDGSVALFNQPAALAIDVSGNHLYVADIGNTAVRRITLDGSTVTVSTLSVMTADDSTLPPSGTTPLVPPGDGNSGGGGAPSHWFFAGLAALALLRLARRSGKN